MVSTWVVMGSVCSCGVLRIAPYVAGGQVASPGVAAPVAGTEIDVDLAPGLAQRGDDRAQVGVERGAVLEDGGARAGHPDPVEAEAGTAPAERGDDPPPARLRSGHGRL